jgi:hypothetical protein
VDFLNEDRQQLPRLLLSFVLLFFSLILFIDEFLKIIAHLEQVLTLSICLPHHQKYHKVSQYWDDLTVLISLFNY